MWKPAIIASSLLALSTTYCYQYNHSFRSVCNLTYAGAQMAAIYKFSHSSIEHKNYKASSYLRDAFKSNGGIYLKLGQLIATLDVIIPD